MISVLKNTCPGDAREWDHGRHDERRDEGHEEAHQEEHRVDVRHALHDGEAQAQHRRNEQGEEQPVYDVVLLAMHDARSLEEGRVPGGR